ncbi:MAG: DUF2085 domain-containing protein [Methanomassiliicoccaceae archaeon]|nr:DUF2085 domain-containing protein [Methanomassiliicoccaceae archaeon]
MRAGIPGLMISAFLFTILALIVAVPLIHQPGIFTGLDGTTGVMDHSWSAEQFIYALGDMFCHQQTERSFVINGSQTAFCARDIGIFVGCALGLILTYRSAGRYPFTDRKTMYLGFVLLSVMAAEWAAGTATGYDLDRLRFAAGAVGGLGIAMVIQNIASEPWKSEGAS